MDKDKILALAFCIVAALAALLAVNVFFASIVIIASSALSILIFGAVFYLKIMSIVGQIKPIDNVLFGLKREKKVAIEQQVEKNMPDLFDFVLPAQRVLVIGTQGMGKTTLLRHLVDEKVKEGTVYIVDPHGFPNKFSAGKVIGAGRQYGDISMFLTEMLEEMNLRYNEYSTGAVGEREHERITIIIDEWTLLYKECKGVIKEFIECALTEFRKVNMDLAIATHSKRVKFMNLEGAGDLFSGFDVITTLKKEDGEYWAELEREGRKQIKCRPPGPYFTPVNNTKKPHVKRVNNDLHGDAPDSQVSELIDIETCSSGESHVNKLHAKILELHSSGQSYNAIAKTVFGSTGGNQNRKIKAILTQYHLG